MNVKLNATKERKSAVKPVKLKPPLESVVQNEICEMLTGLGVFFWRSNNIPSLGRFGVDGKARFRALPKYTPKGIADIICVFNGKFVALEVKREGAKLRPEQAEWGCAVVKNGGNYYKVCSAQEAAHILANV